MTVTDLDQIAVAQQQMSHLKAHPANVRSGSFASFAAVAECRLLGRTEHARMAGMT
jgi:hypothetical protein